MREGLLRLTFAQGSGSRIAKRQRVKSLDLLNYLRDLAGHLALGSPLPWDSVNRSLESIQESLEGRIEAYHQPGPEGTEAVREFMLESLELFLSAVDAIYDFLESKNTEYLSQAVVLAEEANDILSSIEYAVEQQRNWLSQFHSA
mgnify:CR=1 FL=1